MEERVGAAARARVPPVQAPKGRAATRSGA
jgi:hypothetical protein